MYPGRPSCWALPRILQCFVFFVRFFVILLQLLLWLFEGYGVKAKEQFAKGDFLLVYRGELIDSSEASKRDKKYAKQSVGCFMYYFKHAGKTMW